MVTPVDFPLEALDPLLNQLAEAHQKTAPTPIQQVQSDEGVEVCLLGCVSGPMYQQFFFRIRTESGELGVPLEAELGTDDLRLPLYRAEYPFWPESEGVASLMAPLPNVRAPMMLRLRQVRLFTLGAGSRALKVRALAVRPRQAPPLRLSPGNEERYRATLGSKAPVETHRDVYGYWDFRVPSEDPPQARGTPCEGRLELPGGHLVELDTVGPRLLSGRVELDWAGAFAQPPVWEGLSTLHTRDGLAGVGSFQLDGRVTWLFPTDLPDTVRVQALHLYRIPLSPPLCGSGRVSARPLLAETEGHLHLTNVLTGQVPVVLGAQRELVDVLHAHVDAGLQGVTGQLRPGYRFWSQPDRSDVFEIRTSLRTMPTQLVSPLPPEFPTPNHWDAPWVDLLLPQDAAVTPQPGPERAIPPPFVSPTFYSTSPFRMA